MVKIELTDEDAVLFVLFQKHYQIIAPIAGFMDTLNLKDITNSSILMDIDKSGQVVHSSVTKHYRK